MTRKRSDGFAQQTERVRTELAAFVDSNDQLAIVEAPPGSGKTWLLMRGVVHAFASKKRVAVATQTNSQADDICVRFANDFPTVPVYRFVGSHRAVDLGRTVTITSKFSDLPHGPCVVVGTAAKWGLINLTHAFEILFVDEAWQLAWSDFMLLSQVAGRFVLIGDPGQIPPVVRIKVNRWETAPRPPHLSAPSILKQENSAILRSMRLPASRRLPIDTVDLVRPFYDFEFGAWSARGDRQIRCSKGSRGQIDSAIDLLEQRSVCAVTISTPPSGPPMEYDGEIALLAGRVVDRLLKRKACSVIDGVEHPVRPEDIGIAATHRVMLSAIQDAIPSGLRNRIVVDTPERWQGLERPLMIIAHPLSGVTRPSAFDLDTGRLCVMASRHKAGLIVLGRDHIEQTLSEYIPAADQAIGRPDASGRGHHQHLGFWNALSTQGSVVHAA